MDVGAKSEGIVPKNEAGDDEINIGDEIEVVVLQSENDEGHPVLSKRRADFERLWRSIVEARDNETHLDAIVTREVKGGLIVDLGVSAFIPASHVSTRSRANLGHMVGKTIPVRVIEVDRKKDKVIASHRLAADVERKKQEAEAWAKLEKGVTVEGTVRRITDFGAFIDIGGIDGLLHVREMAWNRVEHPSHIVQKGQKLEVLILDITADDRGQKRVALGLKQLQSDPWKKASVAYKTGQTVTGKVTHIAPSCAFVELEENIEAIIPISEMSEERIKTPEDVLTVGQEVEARVKQVQPGQRKITLSLRAAVRDKERRETRDAIKQVNERATGGGSSSGSGSGSSGSGGSSSGGSNGGDGGGALKLGDIFGAQLREARERTKERKKTRDEARAQAKQMAEEEEWDGDPEDLDVDDVMAADEALEQDVETHAGDETVDVSDAQPSTDESDDAAQAGSTPEASAEAEISAETEAGGEETVEAKDVQ